MPAHKELIAEKVDIITYSIAERQDIRPLKLLFLNLMPKKIETEIQFARLLSASPLQIDLKLMTTETYAPKHTEVAYLRQFYRGLNDVKNEYYDALIITGAPVEKMPFEEVSYWNELCEIVDWSLSHCFRRLSVCWGAQALLKHFYNIPKHNYKKKKFGVFNHKLPIYPGRILQGFTENFPMPVSRYTFTKAEDLQKERLKIMAISDEAGVGMVRCEKTGDFYVFNHLEYDANTLGDEYFRDNLSGVETNIPKNYFPNNDKTKYPENTWKPFAYLLISNWLNDLYQDTPFDLKRHFISY